MQCVEELSPEALFDLDQIEAVPAFDAPVFTVTESATSSGSTCTFTVTLANENPYDGVLCYAQSPLGLCAEGQQGFWGLSGNALNNTVTAINQSMGQGLYDLATRQWSGDQWNQISGLMWSTDMPAAPQATPYISTALGISAAAAVTAGAIGTYEAVALGNQSINVSVKGGELVLDTNGRPFFRLNPTGDPNSSNPLGQRPHYHQRPINRPAGPGEGIGRHRPWE